jgi:hypothetical protein
VTVDPLRKRGVLLMAKKDSAIAPSNEQSETRTTHA